MQNTKITIPEWHAMAQAGHPVPMRIPIHGVSMFPLIRIDRDIVTIVPLEGKPEIGDIVLFSDPARGRYVLHRVWKTEEERVLTWGDNCELPDRWLPWDAVWGQAVLIERGRRVIRPDPRKGLIWAKIWHVLGKGYRWSLPRIARAKRIISRIGRRGSGHGKPE